MEGSGRRVDEEELLGQLGWVRALARRLVADPDVADDVLQRVCLLALEKGPDRHAGGPGLRAWLRTTTRRLAGHSVRAAGRRRRHEERAPPGAVSAAPDDDAARRELLRHVTRAVLELDETSFGVLADSYYDGLDVAAIAARRGLSQDAVRQRLSRARRALRARLAPHVQTGWTPALVVAGWLARVKTAGGVAMAQALGKGTAVKLAALVVALGLLSVPVWQWLAPAGTASDAQGELALPARAAPVAQAPAEPPIPVRAAAAVEPLAVAPPAAVADAAAPERPAVVSGRVVDAAGAPVDGALVVFGWLDDDLRHKAGDVARGRVERVPTRATSDAQGGFELTVDLADEPADAGTARLAVLHADHAVTLAAVDALTQPGMDVGEIRLPSGAGLSGRVVDAARDPVGGAWLELHPTPEASDLPPDDVRAARWFLHPRTGEDGTFLVTGLHTGRVDVFVRPQGRGGLRREDLPLHAPQILDLGELVLPEGLAIAGLVVGVDGNPIGDAMISVHAAEALSITTGSDAAGRFRVSGLDPGAYDLHVSEREHAWTRAFGVPAGAEDLRLVMSRYGELLVHVTDEATGEPIAGAAIEASLPRPERFMPWSTSQFEVQPGGEEDLGLGVYRVRGAGPTGTELTVSAAGRVPVRVDAPGVGDGASRRVDVALRPGLVLPGRVVDGRGVGIAGAHVVAEAGADAHTVATAEDGRFRFDVLSAGSWRLEAAAEGHRAPRAVDVALQEVHAAEEVTLVLLPTGRIEGLVTGPEGEPRAGASVRATLRSPATPGRALDGVTRWERLLDAEPGDPDGLWRATADGAGRYAFSDVPEGRYVVWLGRGAHDVDFAVLASILPDETWDAGCRVVDVVAGETTSVDVTALRPAGVQGRVLVDGRPQHGVHVALTYADVEPTTHLGLPLLALVETDALGRYAFDELVPHDHALVAVAPGAPVPTVQAVRPAAGERLPVDLHVSGDEATVTVEDDATGRPLADVELEVRRRRFAEEHPGEALWGWQFPGTVRTLLSGTDVRPFTARSDADGRVRLSHVPAGEYEVLARADAYVEPEPQRLVVPGGPADAAPTFRLVRGAVIEGTLERQPLSRHRGVNVRLFREDGWLLGAVDPDAGRFRFEGLGPGPYVVRAYDNTDLDTPLAEEIVLLTPASIRQVELHVED